jgi:hypothetical protein
MTHLGGQIFRSCVTGLDKLRRFGAMIGEPLWGELTATVSGTGQRSLWPQLHDLAVDVMAQRSNLDGLDGSLIARMVPRLTAWTQVELAAKPHLSRVAQTALARVRRVRVWQTLGERDDLCLEACTILAKWHHPRADFLIFDSLDWEARQEIIARFSQMPGHKRSLVDLSCEYNYWDLLAWCGSAVDIVRWIPTGADLSLGAMCALVLILSESSDPTHLRWAKSLETGAELDTHIDGILLGDSRVRQNARSGVMALMTRSECPVVADVLGQLYSPGSAPLKWVATSEQLDWDSLHLAYLSAEFTTESIAALAGRQDAPDWVIRECVDRWGGGVVPGLRAEHLSGVLSNLSGAHVGMLAEVISAMAVAYRPDAKMFFEELTPLTSLALLLEWFVGEPYRDDVVTGLAGCLDAELGVDKRAWDTFACLIDGFGGSMGECARVAILLSR